MASTEHKLGSLAALPSEIRDVVYLEYANNLATPPRYLDPRRASTARGLAALRALACLREGLAADRRCSDEATLATTASDMSVALGLPPLYNAEANTHALLLVCRAVGAEYLDVVFRELTFVFELHSLSLGRLSTWYVPDAVLARIRHVEVAVSPSQLRGVLADNIHTVLHLGQMLEEMPECSSLRIRMLADPESERLMRRVEEEAGGAKFDDEDGLDCCSGDVGEGSGGAGGENLLPVPVDLYRGKLDEEGEYVM